MNAYVYWDSDVFLAYFNQESGRFADLQAILAEVQASQGHYKIVTSALTKVEVAYIAIEKTTPEAYPNVERMLDEFWANNAIVELIEIHDDVITQARSLIRTAFLNEWRGLRANDALHLGSAQWVTKHVEVSAFHTYNINDFQKFQPVVPFPIQEPRPSQLRLIC